MIPDAAMDMPDSRNTRKDGQRLAVFRTCFSGLTHVYGTYDFRTGRARQVKGRVTDRVICRHLRGAEPLGIYLLCGSRTRAVAVDFDEEDPCQPLQFIHVARKHGLHPYLERSKQKGWHVWLMAELPGVTAAKARLVARSILARIGAPTTEVFPKQDRLTTATPFGNWIHLPLFGRLVAKNRTVFVNPENGLIPYQDQWALLEQVKRVTECELDEIIRRNGLDSSRGVRPSNAANARSELPRAFGLPPCAQRMLAEGVSQFQRVACFRIALHLKRAGLPQDAAIAVLSAWAFKNRPGDGKRVITQAEIVSQTACAYDSSYRSCGCEEPAVIPFCDAACTVRGAGLATIPLPARDSSHPPVDGSDTRRKRGGSHNNERHVESKPQTPR